jgi:MFS transporter, MFS domain-containing protein family, molybdate-anion transporter
MLSDDLYILFAGKFCGGVSTTLLYTVFDAWMITEYHQRDMEARYLSLGMLYGWLTSLNSVVAIATGVIGEVLVSFTGSRVSPFLLATLVFVLTAIWISSTWVSGFHSAHCKLLLL